MTSGWLVLEELEHILEHRSKQGGLVFKIIVPPIAICSIFMSFALTLGQVPVTSSAGHQTICCHYISSPQCLHCSSCVSASCFILNLLVVQFFHSPVFLEVHQILPTESLGAHCKHLWLLRLQGLLQLLQFWLLQLVIGTPYCCGPHGPADALPSQ